MVECCTLHISTHDMYCRYCGLHMGQLQPPSRTAQDNSTNQIAVVVF